jgi:beta-lactamase regulating signal transducer with metallopeptidase domain
MADLLATAVPALGVALLHFLWQGALLGLATAELLHALRDARPQARYAVACAALLACLLLPLATLLAPILFDALANAPAATPVLTSAGGAGTAGGATAFVVLSLSPAPGMDPWLPWIVAAWAAGACAMSLRMAMGLAWIRRLPTVEDGVAQLVWQARLDVLAAHFGLRRGVALRLVHGLDTPAVSGWWRPVVLLPVALLARMPADLVEALLAHELAHVRRPDYLVNLLQNAVEALLFYHPVTWWLSHRIRVEREQVADQLAAEVACSPRRLAVALSELADFQRDDLATLPWLPAARGGQLMARVQTLLRPAGRAHPAARIVFPLLGLVAAGIARHGLAAIAPAEAADVPPYVEPAASVEPETPAEPEAALARDRSMAPPTAPAPQGAAKPASALAPAPAMTADADATEIAVHSSGEVSIDTGGTRVTGRLHDKGDRDFHALVHKRGTVIDSHGSLDTSAIRLLGRLDDGDFLWFRRDGRDYVVTDPAVLARARDAWRESESLGKQMEPLSRQMDAFSDRMEVLSERMEALSEHARPSPEMHAADLRLRELVRQERTLEREQRVLETQLESLYEDDAGTDEARRRDLERRNEEVSAKMEALERQMARQEAAMEAESEALERNSAPMEALSREMEHASEPMEAIGRQMEALGRKIEVAAEAAEVEVDALIDDAVARKLHRPAVAH